MQTQSEPPSYILHLRIAAMKYLAKTVSEAKNTAHAYMVWDSEIEEALADSGAWLRNTLLLPFERYSGVLTLTEKSIMFAGRSLKTGSTVTLEIQASQVARLGLEFDERVKENPRIDGTLKPITVTYRKGDSLVTAYLWVNHDRYTGSTENHIWFQILSSWLASYTLQNEKVKKGGEDE